VIVRPVDRHDLAGQGAQRVEVRLRRLPLGGVRFVDVGEEWLLTSVEINTLVQRMHQP